MLYLLYGKLVVAMLDILGAILMNHAVLRTSEEFGKLIRAARLKQGLTQVDLATASGTGERFIIDLEKGKPTCELNKALHVARMLGIKIEIGAHE